jgi:MFS family permease
LRGVVSTVLRANPPLRRLLVAWGQSCLGTGAGYVALLLLTYRHLHSSWAIAAVLLGEFVPAIVFASWFGSLADRPSRRLLIVIANLLQAGAYGALAASHTAVPIVTLALLAGVGNSLQRPALRSALPLVAGEQQQAAAAIFDTLRWVGMTVGPLIAALFFVFAGPAVPLALDGASFLAAALLIATIGIGAPQEEPGAPSTAAGLCAGLRVAFAAPAIATMIFCSAGAVISLGLLNVAEPILATHVLHGSASDYALLVACYGVCQVLATTLVVRRGNMPGSVLIRRYLAAVTLTAVGMGGSAVAGTVWVAAITFVATGYGNALLLVSEAQLIQQRVANSVQGRLFGARDTLLSAFFLIGLLGAGGLVAVAGVRVTLAAGAGISAICAVAALLALRGGIRAGALAPQPVIGEDGVVEPPAAAAPLAAVRPQAAGGESRRTA